MILEMRVHYDTYKALESIMPQNEIELTIIHDKGDYCKSFNMPVSFGTIRIIGPWQPLIKLNHQHDAPTV